MTYEEFKAAIERGDHITSYYHKLLDHAEDILLDIGMNGQGVVAKQLGVTQPKLSVIKQLLKAYITTEDEV